MKCLAQFAGTILLMVGVVVGATAQVEDQELVNRLYEIRSISAGDERLDAYDAFVDTLPTADESAGALDEAAFGDWVVDRTTDPLSDETRVTMILLAETGRSQYGNPIALIIRQQGNVPDVFVSWNDYFSEDRQRVTHRIDDGEPSTLRWSVSTDNSATFYPRDTTEFVDKLLNAERLVLRTTPYNDSPVTVTFCITGLRAVAEEYHDDLPGWTVTDGGE